MLWIFIIQMFIKMHHESSGTGIIIQIHLKGGFVQMSLNDLKIMIFF